MEKYILRISLTLPSFSKTQILKYRFYGPTRVYP